MMKRFYLPNNDYYRWKWYMNFAAKLPEVANTFGIAKNTVDLIVANSLVLNYVMLYLEKLRETAGLWVTAKDGLFDGKEVEPNTNVPIPKGADQPGEAPPSVPPKILEIAVAVADSIVNNLNATPEILKLLKLVPPSESGIEMPDDRRRPGRPITERPKLVLTVNGTTVTGEITRGSKFRNTNALVYVNRGSGDDYVYLTSTIGSSFVDEVKFPEGVDRITISYQVQLVDKANKTAGDPSEPVAVTVVRPLGG